MKYFFVLICNAVLCSCVGAAQEADNEYNSNDEFMGYIPWQELDLNQPAYSVSMYELISNGEKHDNRYIRVRGFLEYEIKDGAVWGSKLYADTESFEYTVLENSIEVGELLPECSGPLEWYHGDFVLMTGVYRHLRRSLSPIDHIRVIKLDPQVDEILCKDTSIVFHK